jgi:ectoine hydroxylase-related dioxygenase (phytanoyl-CoA dioxygenase family)
MWALDDFTVENGATRYVPGSVGRAPEDWPAESECVDATMPAGSVLLYVGTLVHGGGANRSSQPRLGVILEYVAAWLRAQENHVIGVGPELAATLPVRLQQLLGWNIYPPFVGYVDGRDPRRFLPRP